MDYSAYKAEDFLSEASFLAWYYRTDASHQDFWTAWITGHPEKQKDVEEAVRILQWLESQGKPVPQQQATAAKRQLLAAVEDWDEQQTKSVSFYRNRRQLWTSIAASVVILLGISFWWLHQPVTYQAAYGETEEITLPDGSQVVLNANSTLYRDRFWNRNNEREIWLEGEAYFSVVHTETHTKFLVHVNGLAVEVLGTSFNVWKRKDKVRVVLDEGKVKLSSKDLQKPLIMQPGELVEIEENEEEPLRKTVNTALYTAWKDHKLVFERTPLKEIAGLIEHNYGLTVQVHGDSSLLERPFTYTLMGNDLDLLLNTLSESLNLDIARRGQHILMEEK